MKNIILSSFIFLFSLGIPSQGEPQLAINGLHQAKKMARMTINSAVLENNTCIITKPVDRHSNNIEQASETGKVFPKVFLKMNTPDGQTTKELTTVYIRNYSISVQGNTSIETFTMYYNKITARE